LARRLHGAPIFQHTRAVEIQLTRHRDYVHIAVTNQGGVDDARALMQRIVAEIEGGTQRLLVSVRRSHALFKVEQYGLSDALRRLAGITGIKIALVGYSPELIASYQYVELLASQKGVAAKAFASEKESLRWLLS
jgi:hypothetical protein